VNWGFSYVLAQDLVLVAGSQLDFVVSHRTDSTPPVRYLGPHVHRNALSLCVNQRERLFANKALIDLSQVPDKQTPVAWLVSIPQS
jgi:hypothetical protein